MDDPDGLVRQIRSALEEAPVEQLEGQNDSKG